MHFVLITLSAIAFIAPINASIKNISHYYYEGGSEDNDYMINEKGNKFIEKQFNVYKKNCGLLVDTAHFNRAFCLYKQKCIDIKLYWLLFFIAEESIQFLCTQRESDSFLAIASPEKKRINATPLIDYSDNFPYFSNYSIEIVNHIAMIEYVTEIKNSLKNMQNILRNAIKKDELPSKDILKKAEDILQGVRQKVIDSENDYGEDTQDLLTMLSHDIKEKEQRFKKSLENQNLRVALTSRYIEFYMLSIYACYQRPYYVGDDKEIEQKGKFLSWGKSSGKKHAEKQNASSSMGYSKKQRKSVRELMW